jgi:hypothetical protein
VTAYARVAAWPQLLDLLITGPRHLHAVLGEYVMHKSVARTGQVPAATRPR